MHTRFFWHSAVLLVCAALVADAAHGFCGAGPVDDQKVIVAAGNQNVTIEMKRYSLYSPELQLVAETSTSAGTPWIVNEYVWFNGEPLAQVNVPSGEVAYSFNDHLGAPIVQTDAAGAVVWRVERDPYGERYATRVGADRDQPLGLPGQEYDATSDRQYNIFRWYRVGWGRYTQNDPELWVWSVHPDPYRYVDSNPVRFVDKIGLYAVMPSCSQSPFNGQIQAGIADSCKRTTTPGTKCHNALRNISAALGDPSANKLTNCFKKACTEPGPNLACDPCMDEPCARISSGFGTSSITIGRGASSGCPAGRGLGYGGTVFHETLHHCGFGSIFGGDEPHHVGPRASWFRYAEMACYGWRDPNAPPFGPPQPRN